MKLLTALSIATLAAFGATVTIDPTLYLDDVKFLASDDMRGRATGSPELEKAADFIAGRFRALGLKPLRGDSYFQDFDVTTSAHLGAHNSLTYTSGGHKKALKFQQEYI